MVSFGFNENLIKSLERENKLYRKAKNYVEPLENMHRNATRTARYENTRKYLEYYKTVSGNRMSNLNPYRGEFVMKSVFNPQANENENVRLPSKRQMNWVHSKHNSPYYLNNEELKNKLKRNYTNVNGRPREVLYYLYKNPGEAKKYLKPKSSSKR